PGRRIDPGRPRVPGDRLLSRRPGPRPVPGGHERPELHRRPAQADRRAVRSGTTTDTNTIAYRLRSPTQPASRALSTVLRLVLGAVWLAAGLLKVNDAEGMVRSVRAFRILPEALVHPVAYSVPFLEIALGVLLIVGLAVRVTAAVSTLMFAVYIAAIISAAARGLRIDCGCFSSGGDVSAGASTHY